MDCNNKLSKLLFSVSSTAKQIHLGQTKAKSIVTRVLSTLSVQQIRKDLNISTDNRSQKCLPYSVSSVASNNGNIKMFPLIVQYFTLKTGINVQLLYF